MDPGVVATAVGHRRETGVVWARIRGGIAVAWFAEGGEESGGQDRASAWPGVPPGAGGRALGALCHGFVEVVEGWHGDAELADKGLHQASRGREAPRLGGQGCGPLAGLEALVHDVGVAPMLGAAAALEGRAARERHGCEGRPGGEDVADDGGVLVVEPWQDRRAVGVQGPGEALRETSWVADQTTARCDEWFAGTYGGALGGAGCEFVAMREPERTLECGVRRVVLGLAGRADVPGPRAGEGGDGQEDAAVILTQGGDEGPRVELETDGQGLPLEPRAQGAHPRLKGVWLGFEPADRTCLGARCLPAAIVVGLSPAEADAGCQLGRR